MEDASHSFESGELPEGQPRETIFDEMASKEAVLFGHELAAQVKKPPAGDIRIAAFGQAAHELFTDWYYPGFRQGLHSLLKDRLKRQLGELEGITAPPIRNAHVESPSYHVNRMLRSLQRQVLSIRNYQPHYIETLDRPEPWRDLIYNALDRNTKIGQDFAYDFVHRDVQSNVSERYKGPLLATKIMPERFQGSVSILDLGCSQNQGLKRWSMMHLDPFRGLQFGDIRAGNLASTADSQDLFVPDTQLTQHLNSAMAEGQELERGLGVDVSDIFDIENRLWAKVCSFYPSELLPPDPDSGRINREDFYDLVEAALLDNVGFFQGDFSNLDTTAFERASGGQRYDLAIFSTVLYLTSRAQQADMIENAKRYLKPNGLIVIQDFVHLEDNELVFEESWFQKPYPYRTLVLDPHDPNGTFREVFRWNNGRCGELALGADAGMYGFSSAA